MRLVKVTARELVAVVDYQNGDDVRVRHQLARPGPWRCSRCGPQPRPTCPHAVAVDLTTQALEVLTDPDDERTDYP